MGILPENKIFLQRFFLAFKNLWILVTNFNGAENKRFLQRFFKTLQIFRYFMLKISGGIPPENKRFLQRFFKLKKIFGLFLQVSMAIPPEKRFKTCIYNWKGETSLFEIWYKIYI